MPPKLMNPKISIIGSGSVGSTTAHLIALKSLADIVLVDINESKAKGIAYDITHSLAIEKSNISVIGTGNYSLTKNSDVIIITAGIPRKPGMSRDELLDTNTKIVKSVSEEVSKYSKAVIIVVTNPLDAMVPAAAMASKFPKNKVIGMAGVLDTARFKSFISTELRVPIDEVETIVIGSHGDTMVPLISQTFVSKKPITKLLSKEKLNELVERTRNAGAEIVSLLGSGSAYYAPASSIVEMVDSILNNNDKILPCCAYLNGEYGVNGYFIGVPVRLGKNGVEEILELELSPEEQAQLRKTVEYVKDLVGKIRL